MKPMTETEIRDVIRKLVDDLVDPNIRKWHLWEALRDTLTEDAFSEIARILKTEEGL